MFHVADWFLWPWPLGAWGFHILLFVLVASHCLQRRREATSALLWMVVVWSIPLIGPILYLMFGIDRVHVKGFQKHLADQRLLAARRAINQPVAHVAISGDAFSRELNRGMDSMMPDHPLMGGNEILPLVTGDEAFPAMIASIRKAERTINMATFIISDDAIGRQVLDLLAEKARSGVKVRFMYDRFGSTYALLGGMFRRYRSIKNLRIVGWTQANPLKHQFQVNLRNHRKILVVDGKQAFIGGINIHEEHASRGGKLAIRDYHFSVRGPIVQELQYTFMRDWFFMTDEAPSTLLGEDNFPALESVGSCAARVVNGGPADGIESIADVFFMAIVSAHRQVIAVTPYFVPNHDIIQAMRSAALRGVEVKLVVPLENNHISAGFASRALYEDLLNAGVRIFERQPPFMHAKALIVDDEFAYIGTSNLDIRSFRLDYETNLAVCNTMFAERLKRIVIDDIEQSTEVKWAAWVNRPLHQRVLENLFSLLVPVL